MARRATGLALAVAVSLAACAGGGGDGAAADATVATVTTAPVTTAPGTTATGTTVATTEPRADALVGPSGDAFYEPAAPAVSGPPGTVIWWSEPAPVAGGTLRRVLYRSRSVDGRPIAVSGLVALPDGASASSPMVSWAHGTTGSADACAPSRQAQPYLPDLADLLARGWVVAATDYEGLGTPGPHPYLVGRSEGQGVLDIARAVARAGLASNRVVIWGHSQGGQAAVWAGQLAAEYAPELDVLGTVAVAPAAQPSRFIAAAGGIPQFLGFFAAAGRGLAAAHPELDLADVMTPEAIARLDVLETGCIGEVLGAFAELGVPGMRGDPLALPDWGSRLRANDAGSVPMRAPLLVTQGLQDTLVLPALTAEYVTAACRTGTSVEYRTYPGADHGSVMVDGKADVLAWMADRFAGRPAVSTCAA